jgi:hypothetical protein
VPVAGSTIAARPRGKKIERLQMLRDGIVVEHRCSTIASSGSPPKKSAARSILDRAAVVDQTFL